jgi:hypothetical protein
MLSLTGRINLKQWTNGGDDRFARKSSHANCAAAIRLHSQSDQYADAGADIVTRYNPGHNAWRHPPGSADCNPATSRPTVSNDPGPTIRTAYQG